MVGAAGGGGGKAGGGGLGVGKGVGGGGAGAGVAVSPTPSPSLPPSHPRPPTSTLQTTPHAPINQPINQPSSKDRNFTLKISLKSIGLSVIAERPVRREFLSLYIDGIDATMSQRTINNYDPYTLDGVSVGQGPGQGLGSGLGLGPAAGPGLSAGSAMTSYQLEISDIQIDNYSETAIRPVLLHSFSSSRQVTPFA